MRKTNLEMADDLVLKIFEDQFGMYQNDSALFILNSVALWMLVLTLNKRNVIPVGDALKIFHDARRQATRVIEDAANEVEA